jgi:hypothetical protein
VSSATGLGGMLLTALSGFACFPGAVVSGLYTHYLALLGSSVTQMPASFALEKLRPLCFEKLFGLPGFVPAGSTSPMGSVGAGLAMLAGMHRLILRRNSIEVPHGRAIRTQMETFENFLARPIAGTTVSPWPEAVSCRSGPARSARTGTTGRPASPKPYELMRRLRG